MCVVTIPSAMCSRVYKAISLNLSVDMRTVPHVCVCVCVCVCVTGIQPWEEKYSEMAEAMGIDPTVRMSHVTNVLFYLLCFVFFLADKQIRPICSL